MAPTQQSIFSAEQPGLDETLGGLRRVELADGAWVDYLPTWVQGQDALYRQLESSVAWSAERRRMYDRVVAVPRLLGGVPHGTPAGTFLGEVALVLSRRYHRRLDGISLAWYRDGRDSVAMHGDKLGRRRDECIVAIVALGGPRRFLLRRVRGDGALDLSLGWGDLLVMGGTCQRTWRHGIPKVARAQPRISVMFRPGEGRG